jgi:hypothetical protein
MGAAEPHPAFGASSGRPQEELLARPYMDDVSPDDAESVAGVVGELADDRIAGGFTCW